MALNMLNNIPQSDWAQQRITWVGHILASSVLYELIGPACAKLSLYLSGSYSNRLDDIVTETVKCDEHEPENEVERLIRQIQAIQKELPAHNDPFLEDEQAYDEAAYEHYALTG